MLIDAPTPVEAVVVRSTRLPDSPGDAAFSVIRIDPQQLQSRPRLDEALTATPGAALFRRTSSLAANPTTQGLSLREIAPSGAGRALVLLDRTPQNDPFGGWVIWSALPPEGVAGATITRGAGAGPYGAGALTGVVSLDSVEGSALRADLSAGELGLRRAGLAAAGEAGPVDALFTASAQHSDGWTPVRGGRPADKPLALDGGSASLRLQGDAGPAVLAARVGAYQETRQSGLLGANARARGVNASLTLAHKQADASGWRLQGWVARSDLRNRSVAVAANRQSTTPANDQYETPALGYGFNAALRGEGGRWELGADVRAADGETREFFRYMGTAFTRDRIAGGRTLVAGIYGEAQRQDGPWLFTGGLRIDRWSSSGGQRTEHDLATRAVVLDNRPADRDGWVPTARLGLRRDLGGEAYARAAAYAGFRPPTLNELHRPFRVGNDITEANPSLEPERLYGLEAGVGGHGEAHSWAVTLFVNRLQDPVTNVTLGIGPGTFPIAGFIPAGGVLRQRANAGRIDAVGLEAEADARLAPWATLHGALAYTQAEVDGGTAAPQLTGLRPAQAPRVSAHLGVELKPADRLSIQLDLRHEGMRFEDDLNSRRLKAFTTLDARVGASLSPQLEVYLAADNLADADVATGQTVDGVTSYGPPRAVRVGLSWRQ